MGNPFIEEAEADERRRFNAIEQIRVRMKIRRVQYDYGADADGNRGEVRTEASIELLDIIDAPAWLETAINNYLDNCDLDELAEHYEIPVEEA